MNNKKKRMRGMWRVLALLAGGVTAIPTVDAAADSPPEASKAEPVEIEVTHAPKILDWPKDSLYPQKEVLDGREGWVILALMLDATGKPRDAIVAESSGNAAFEKSALRSVERMTFQPARRAGGPVESSFIFKIKFTLGEPARGARPVFVKLYRQFSDAVQAGDKAKADGLLPSLIPKNLYEEAFAHLGKFNYHMAWGTVAQQRDDLAGAIAGERGPTYLPKELFVTALYMKFKLEVQAHDYGMALSTWDVLEPLATSEVRQKLRGAINQIYAIQGGGQPVVIDGAIDDHNRWRTQLLRNDFSILVKSGAVSQVHLVCARKFLTFNYEPGIKYSVGQTKDRCHVRLMGEPGSTFEFVQ